MNLVIKVSNGPEQVHVFFSATALTPKWTGGYKKQSRVAEVDSNRSRQVANAESFGELYNYTSTHWIWTVSRL